MEFDLKLKFRTAGFAAVALTLLIAAFTATAQAGLHLCNKTDSEVGVAIGYEHKNDLVSEGWWNLTANDCQLLLKKDLNAIYYYIYALDYEEGREWGGGKLMCTSEKEFKIKGAEECIVRGYERVGFFEINTGGQKSWTVQLTEPVEQGTGGR